MISPITKQRLEWLSKASAGELIPNHLFGSSNWAEGMREMAVEVLGELERLQKELDERS